MKKVFDLTGKQAVVTGGGSGIGKAICESLTNQGASIFLLDYNADQGSAVAAAINKSGGEAVFIQCDVSNEQSVQDAINQVSEEIDILVNNAGIAHVGTVETTSSEDFQRVYDVNVKGVFNCTKAAIGKMKKKGGSIINMASVASLTGIADRFAYSMSKGAVHTMTLSVAKDYLTYNIRCNCLAPGRVHTPFVDVFLAKNYPGKEEEMFEKLSKTQPIGRMGQPQEIANLVLYLCSDEASFITGSCYPIDGGFTTLNT